MFEIGFLMAMPLYPIVMVDYLHITNLQTGGLGSVFFRRNRGTKDIDSAYQKPERPCRGIDRIAQIAFDPFGGCDSIGPS